MMQVSFKSIPKVNLAVNKFKNYIYCKFKMLHAKLVNYKSRLPSNVQQ